MVGHDVCGRYVGFNQDWKREFPDSMLKYFGWGNKHILAFGVMEGYLSVREAGHSGPKQAWKEHWFRLEKALEVEVNRVQLRLNNGHPYYELCAAA